MLDQECTQTHFDCAGVVADWLVNLHGGDVLKARQFLRQLDADDIFTACVDIMLAAIEDSRRASGDITRPAGTTICELLDAIEAHDEALNTWQRVTRILRQAFYRIGPHRATCTVWNSHQDAEQLIERCRAVEEAAQGGNQPHRNRFFQRFWALRNSGS
jgi:hypothetical protein